MSTREGMRPTRGRKLIGDWAGALISGKVPNVLVEKVSLGVVRDVVRRLWEL